MVEEILLLVDATENSTVGRLEKILAFLGVVCRQVTVSELLAVNRSWDDEARYRLVSSSSTFIKLLDALIESSDARSRWRMGIHSAFIFRGDDSESLQILARRVIGETNAPLVRIDSHSDWVVSDRIAGFCKSMSGIRVHTDVEETQTALCLEEERLGAIRIIYSNDATAFVRLEFQGIPIFVSTSDVVDVSAELRGPTFDVRRHFLTAVPIVLYVKWACPKTCWQSMEVGACLVIDDPLLRPRYGLLSFQDLLGVVKRAKFSTSIAFIPWNWNRSTKEVVQLFKENANRLSLSIHGCDHTGGEFGSTDTGRLAWKTRQATDRMMRLEATTGLSHDPVMVFPQGIFSQVAMAVLKRSAFIGVVNSEVISTDTPRPIIRVEDYWNVAVMNYSDFPIFTRRYPSQGVENFAFDVLLGKPCIVVAHHSDCGDGCRRIVEFIERLNRLNARLMWTSLGEIVRRSARQREISAGVMEIEMYGNEARFENSSNEAKTLRIRKRETAPAAVKEIRVGPDPVRWNARDDHVHFGFQVDSNGSKAITIAYAELAESGYAGDSVGYKIKAVLRRYLSEIRDNYVMRKSLS